MQNYPVKVAKIIESEELAKIHQSCFEEGWSNSDIASYLARAYCYSLWYENIGFVIFEIIEDECEIKTIAVLKEHRRKKLAQKLCEEVTEIAKGFNVKKIFLEVSEKNEPAINLYKKLGFEEYSHRKDYYAKGEDAILLKYNL